MKFGRLVTGALAIGCFGLTLSGCGSDSSSGPADPVAVTGTAAVGAALANAGVTLRCGAGDNVTTVTNAAGVYTVLQSALTGAGATLPCAVKVTGEAGGEPVTLFSFAQEGTGTARVNVTPLTDLAVAHMVNTLSGTTAEDWFAAPQLTLPTSAAVLAARDAVQTAVADAAGAQQLPFDIFSTNFAANGVSEYDVWLDRLNAALQEAGVGYVDFVASYVGSSHFGSIVIDLTPDTGTGGNGGATTDLYLTVTVTTMGQTTTAPETIVQDVPAPGADNEFCGGVYSDYIPADGVLNITSCSFSGNRGEIHATMTSPGLPTAISYVAVYEWR